ncbi:MAG: glycosyltransferase family 4 protein [Candidatus Azambacteria bacterium]|nr:glycosyltransferase family 4 protein [Candidatus Azambacteria bacterium]
MIILSNDYTSNTPSSRIKSQGGPAAFAKIFSRYVTARGHQWVGIIEKTDTRKVFRHQKKEYSKKRTYVEVRYNRKYITHITKATKNIDPCEVLSPRIIHLAKVIRSISPDIIFLNGFSLSSWVLMMAGHMAGIPIVMQHAGIWGKEIKMYSDWFPSAARKILYEMERDISRFADHEIFLNKRSWQAYNESVAQVGAHRATVIPLPYASFVYHEKKRKKDAYDIGIVARWDRIKNHEAFLRVAKKAHEKKMPWTFHAVTSIPDTSTKKKFKDEYRKFISVKKPMDRKGITRFYKKMDLMILPSHFDVSPFVVIEAAMEGTTTLISPNVGHADEYKKAGAQKWVIDFSDVAAVVRRIQKIISTAPPKKLIRSFEKLHNPERVCSQYLQLFTTVLNQKK